MQKFLGFDPLVYLDIKLKDEGEEEKINQKYLLLEQISQYLFIRFSEEISTEKLKSFNNYQDLLSYANKNIPKFQEKIKRYLDEFREEMEV